MIFNNESFIHSITTFKDLIKHSQLCSMVFLSQLIEYEYLFTIIKSQASCYSLLPIQSFIYFKEDRRIFILLSLIRCEVQHFLKQLTTVTHRFPKAVVQSSYFSVIIAVEAKSMQGLDCLLMPAILKRAAVKEDYLLLLIGF